MGDMIPNQGPVTFGALGLAIGGVLIKGVPAALKWLTRNMDTDKNDKFGVMHSWIDQLRKDTEEARADAKEALKSVRDCESKHDETFKAMYEDRVKYEVQMARLEEKFKTHNEQLQIMQYGMRQQDLDRKGDLDV